METHFASPERDPAAKIEQQHLEVVSHPVVGGMLQLVSGMLAVLNEHRQVVALNEQLAEYLGITDLAAAFGLRPGEAVACVRAEDMPGGCGTGPFCSSCGAAVAIVTSLEDNKPISRKCAIEVQNGGRTQDVFLQVQSVPVVIEEKAYLLLFIQDISAAQKWAAMEQVFFHDINNILAGVVSVSNLLLMESSSENRDMVKQLSQSSRRITQEVAIQRCLMNSEAHSYTPVISSIRLQSVFDELAAAFHAHPVADGKVLSMLNRVPDAILKTDYTLVMRVLNNMIINALEATSTGGEVVVECVESESDVRFQVWNAGEISKEIQPRLFQRNISTKTGMGRGVGTYSMKLFGEEILGGKVAFQSSKVDGTTFSFILQKNRSGSVVPMNPA